MISHARDARGWSSSVALLPTSPGRRKGKVRMRLGNSYNAIDTDKGPLRHNLRHTLLRKNKRSTIRMGYPEASQGYRQSTKPRETLQTEFLLLFCKRRLPAGRMPWISCSILRCRRKKFTRRPEQQPRARHLLRHCLHITNQSGIYQRQIRSESGEAAASSKAAGLRLTKQSYS